ncbi:uncharacterized protein LOC124531403 [Vanessa cardui]|uniref:uncharacterized protein LOC124531403 n=1 Tax=Vanessa cardui TaxID=171605 RepID=UPI001F12ADC8|nr:uncharacterized protein LOC124531403 [Vanessa cardui]
MKTVYNDKSNINESESNMIKLKVRSAPIQLSSDPSEKLLKEHFSAPSYLQSLKENLAPPFKIPVKEEKPRLLIGTIVTEIDVIAMIAAENTDPSKGLDKYLGNFLVKNKILLSDSLSEKYFLISLLKECIDYSAHREFTASKLACFITIYLATHNYFKWYYWMPPTNVWNFFKEIMIRHTIEDSPDGQEVFEPEECYDILSHFHIIYLTNLPLIHILTFRVHRLKLLWPFKPK